MAQLRTEELEFRLHVAHRVLWRAAMAAADLDWFETYEDVLGMLQHVESLVDDCVRAGSRLRTRPTNRAYPRTIVPSDPRTAS
jgi:hypothetical protein